MPKKPTDFLHALTVTLRSGLLRQTTVKQSAQSTESSRIKNEALAPTLPARSKSTLPRIGHGMMIGWAIVAATGAMLPAVQSWERQTQSLMFRVRGAVAPPDDVVILAIDDDTLLQLSGSSRLLRRAAYARAIDRVMAAGAKTVATNLILDLPSFGTNSSIDCSTPNLNVEDDDRQLQQVLQRYDGRITLGVDLDRLDNRQGEQMRLALPFCPFRTPNASFGLILYPKEANDRLYRLGSESLRSVRSSPEIAQLLDEEKVLPFAEATLRSARIQVAQPRGENIFFFGGDGTFSKTTIPFWNVLSNENWNSDYLQQGRIFKDKIVLIGVTASKNPDTQNTPFGSMPSIELHANAIATLLQNKAIRTAFPDASVAAMAVFLLVLGAGVGQARAKRPVARLGWAIAIAAAWAGVGYAVFVQNLMILPIAVPSGAIVLVGLSYAAIGLSEEYRDKRHLRQSLKPYAGAPIVQEIFREHPDFLPDQEREFLGKTIGARYKMIKSLGAGGFGETYIAEDTQRPGNPQCVVKRLRPTSNNPRHLQLARRLFKSEADSLQQLGEHDQIPRLLAYFEEAGEFYLVQEFVAGAPMSEALTIGRHLPEAKVAALLRDLLNILSFVHSNNVIHRDIKPSNIIQRSSDQKSVLIDFGAVKALHHQLIDADSVTATIGIGTQGYMPPEQCAGNPRLNSDLYAVGMIGIQALTGLPPSQLKADPQTGEIAWRDRAIVSSALANVLSRMVHYDFRSRYQSATEVLHDLDRLANLSTLTLPPEFFDPVLDVEDETTTTRPWPSSFGAEELPTTQPPPIER